MYDGENEDKLGWVGRRQNAQLMMTSPIFLTISWMEALISLTEARKHYLEEIRVVDTFDFRQIHCVQFLFQIFSVGITSAQ